MTSLWVEYFCVLLVVAAAAAVGSNQGSVTLRKFECTSIDPEIVKDVQCFSKPIRNKFGNMTVSMFFIQPVAKLWVNVSSFMRVSSNTYRRGQFHFRENLCTLAKVGFSSLMYKIVPGALAFMRPELYRCPMSGLYDARNVVIENIDPTFFRTFMATGDYKLALAIINAATEKIITSVETSVAFKGVSTYMVG